MNEKSLINALKSNFGIENLNSMQNRVSTEFSQNENILLLSPTGSGKTIAFAIPILKKLNEPNGKIKAIVIAPSRELVIQIWNVIRPIAEGYKVTCFYGGHSMIDEKQSLSVCPDIIISTPGRLLDHINRKNIDIYSTKFLVLDEFDKSLELGFQDEMKKIIKRMPNLSKRILTSATDLDELPEFLGIETIKEINFLDKGVTPQNRITVFKAISEDKDKLVALKILLANISVERTIIFANHRESAERIYEYLDQNNLSVGLYHGGLEQIDREKAISLFNNGTNLILVSTDLGSRGLDIKEVNNIIHYHIPSTLEAYTHRNGRTARIDAQGNVYILASQDEKVPSFIKINKELVLDQGKDIEFKANISTLYFQAGRKEKISKGDILGFLLNNTDLTNGDIGQIEIKDHYALVAVPKEKISAILKVISPLKIKNKKVRISEIRR